MGSLLCSPSVNIQIPHPSVTVHLTNLYKQPLLILPGMGIVGHNNDRRVILKDPHVELFCTVQY